MVFFLPFFHFLLSSFYHSALPSTSTAHTHFNTFVLCHFKDKYWMIQNQTANHWLETSLPLLLSFCLNICLSHCFFPPMWGMVKLNTINLIKTVTEFIQIRNSLSASLLMMCIEMKLWQGQRGCKRQE